MYKARILIPTYFAGPMLLNCVDSIMKSIREPEVEIFKNDIGWLKACNYMAGKNPGDIILLNDDTVILTDIVQEMTELAYSDPKIGIVGGKALSPSTDTIINYGIYVATDGNTAHKHFGQLRNSVQVEKQQAVEASCMFIKGSLIEEIGLFDEGYGMGYREEVDLCFRAREAGYKVISCPTAEYVHFTNQTHGKLGITNSTHEYFMSKWGTKLKLGLV